MPPSPSRGKDSYPASSPGSQTSCSPHGPTPNEFPLSASLWHFSNNPPVGTRRYPTLSLLQSQPPRAPAASLCNLYVALHGMCCPPPGCECSGPVNCCQYHLFCPVSHIRSSLEPWGKTLSLPSRLREDEQNNSMSLFFFYWRLITLQYCGGFCHKFTWISHGCTCVLHPETPSRLPPHPIP